MVITIVIIIISTIISVCNDQGCSTAGMGTAMVDREVEGDVQATGMTVTADGDNWVVRWTVEGNADDVAMWHVCYLRGEEFIAANMPTECPDSVMGTSNTSMVMTIVMTMSMIVAMTSSTHWCAFLFDRWPLGQSANEILPSQYLYIYV